MVRLKVKSDLLNLSETLFQFHMVRLKEPPWFYSFFPYCISIPHGTIKSSREPGAGRPRRQFQFHMVRLKGGRLGDAEGLDEFQFHMVRLKAIDTECRRVRIVFQFHMVRLKGLRSTCASSRTTFQFHMVRLKGIAARALASDNPNFNSTWYD